MREASLLCDSSDNTVERYESGDTKFNCFLPSCRHARVCRASSQRPAYDRWAANDHLLSTPKRPEVEWIPMIRNRLCLFGLRYHTTDSRGSYRPLSSPSTQPPRIPPLFNDVWMMSQCSFASKAVCKTSHVFHHTSATALCRSMATCTPVTQIGALLDRQSVPVPLYLSMPHQAEDACTFSSPRNQWPSLILWKCNLWKCNLWKCNP